MKKILYSILMGGVLLFIPTSCENEVKDLSKVTYYADLQLNGDELVKLNIGDTYNEPGYKATENGEDITEKVKVNGSVDTQTSDFYNLVYSVANVDGFSVSKTRTVMVVDKDNFASAYLGESKAGTRHYTDAPIKITDKGNGTYEISDILGGLQFYGINAGAPVDLQLEAVITLGPDNKITLNELGSWYFDGQLTVGLTSGEYDPQTGVVTLSVDYGGTPLSVTLTK